MKVKSESEVTQSWDFPGKSMEWGAIAFSDIEGKEVVKSNRNAMELRKRRGHSS